MSDGQPIKSEAELEAMRKDNIRASQEAEDAMYDQREREGRRGISRGEEMVEEAKQSISKKFQEDVLGNHVDEDEPDA